MRSKENQLLDKLYSGEPIYKPVAKKDLIIVERCLSCNKLACDCELTKLTEEYLNGVDNEQASDLR